MADIPPIPPLPDEPAENTRPLLPPLVRLDDVLSQPDPEVRSRFEALLSFPWGVNGGDRCSAPSPA